MSKVVGPYLSSGTIVGPTPNPKFPLHLTASPAALANIQNLTSLSKSTPLQIVAIGDSNHTPGTFMAALWERDNFARKLDESLAWMRSNSDAMTSEILGPQSQIIKFSTMGNAPVYSPTDTPWHPNKKRFVGEPRTIPGPYPNSYKALGGFTFFDDSSKSNRIIGFLVDRTASGEDWERNMNRVAVGYSASGPGQGVGVNSGSALKANGSTYSGATYGAPTSPFTISIRDVSALDFSVIPSTGWDEADSNCIALKASLLSISNTASKVINPNFGGTGGVMPGYLSDWVTGMTANKKWLVLLSVADGVDNGGTALEYLLLNNSTIVGGVNILDMAYSGNAINHCEWKRYNSDGSSDPTWGRDPLTGDIVAGTYVSPSLASRVLMRKENTYGLSGYFGSGGWSTATSTQHNLIGLDAVVISVYVNDVVNTSFMPAAIQNYCSDIIAQVKRVNPGAVVIFNLPPCPGFIAGDNNRDNYFTGNGGVRATDRQFRDAIRAAVAGNPANAVILDYQQYHNNVAPTVLKGRIGQFGIYKRQSADPVDVLHFKASTWQDIAASDISRLFQTWCFA